MTNQPTQYDAIKGGDNQTTAAVLGGIEGARRRFHQAKKFRQRYAAWLEIAKYDPAEAERLSNQLIRLNIELDEAGVQKINDAIASVQQAAVNMATTIAPAFKNIIDRFQYLEQLRRNGVISDYEYVSSLRELQNMNTPSFPEKKAESKGILLRIWDAKDEAEWRKEKELEKKHIAKLKQSSYLDGVERIIGKRKRKY